MIAPEDDLELLNNEGESADESKFSSFFLGPAYRKIKELMWSLGIVIICLMISSLVFTYTERKWEIMQSKVDEGEEVINFIDHQKQKELDRIYNDITNQLDHNNENIQSFKELARQMCAFKRNGQYDYQWHFGGSLDFVLGVLTTTGWGNIVPVTTGGKLLTCIYIIGGIPVMFLFMYTLISVLDSALTAIRHAFYNMLKGMEQDPDWWALYAITAIFTSLLLLMLLIVAGISVKRKEVEFSHSGEDILPQWAGSGTSHWTFWDGLYFQVISMLTIGFGDYHHKSYDASFGFYQFFFVFLPTCFFVAVYKVLFNQFKEKRRIIVVPTPATN